MGTFDWLILRYMNLIWLIQPRIVVVSETRLQWETGHERHKISFHRIECRSWFEYDDALKFISKLLYGGKIYIKMNKERPT